MRKTKKQLLKDMLYIEEYSEYIYEGDYSYNSLRSFVNDHLDEANDNQEDEIWLYCDASESDIY